MNCVYHEHDFARTQKVVSCRRIWAIPWDPDRVPIRWGVPLKLEEPDEGLRPMEGRTRARFVCVWEKRTNVVLSPLLHDIAGCIHRFIVCCAEIFFSCVSISSSLSPDP